MNDKTLLSTDRLGLRGKTAAEGFAFNIWYLAKHGPHSVSFGNTFFRFTPVGPMIAWNEGRR